MPLPLAFCPGIVVHKRVRPVEHRLSYDVFSLLLDVDQLSEQAKSRRFFSIDRFNLLSVHQKDHGHKDGRSVSDFVRDMAAKADMEGEIRRAWMLCYPRILGYAFNPITVYFCCGADAKIRLMIYEVRNTFGEHVTYVMPAGEPRNGVYSHVSDKAFYVSPFNNVEGSYRFHTALSEDVLTVGVALSVDDAPLLRTHFKAAIQPLGDGTIVKAVLAYPFMTLKVVAAIHWEAAKLYLKGLRLKDRPKPPKRWIRVADSGDDA